MAATLARDASSGSVPSEQRAVGSEPARHPAERVSLVDLLDRVLAGGVVITGEITLSVADVDLVTVSLRALLSSVSALLPPTMTRPALPPSRWPRKQRPQKQRPRKQQPRKQCPRKQRRQTAGRLTGDRPPGARPLPAGLAGPGRSGRSGPRPGNPGADDRGTAARAEERQAIRRVEDGTVTDEEAERLGRTFMLLNERMDELTEEFGIRREDLNLDLGPPGTLPA